MKDLFSQVLNMSLTASVMIVLVILVRLALKRAPKIYSYALWSVVLFRLLCPVSLPSPVSLLGVLDAPVAEPESRITTVVYFQPEAPFQTVGGTEQEAPMLPTEKSSIGAISEAETVFHHTVSWMEVLSMIWLAGAAGLYAFGIGNYLRFRRKLRYAWKVKGNVYLLDHIDTPFAAGILRPRIYLPSDLPEDQRAYIVAHERCHIRRLDLVTRGLSFAALCLHWFNPLVWLAFVLSGRDMEMSCDEAVIRRLGPNIRRAYSQSLLNLAAGGRMFHGAPLAFGEGNTGGRIRNLARWRKPKIGVSMVCLALSLAILVACGLNPPVSNTEAVQTSSTALPQPEWTQEEAMTRCREVLDQVQNSEGYQILTYQENWGEMVLNDTSVSSFWKSGDNWLSMNRIPTAPPDNVYAYLYWDGEYWNTETTGGFDEEGHLLWDNRFDREAPEPWLAAFRWSDEKISLSSVEDAAQQRIVHLSVSEPYTEDDWTAEAGYSVDFVFSEDGSFSYAVTTIQFSNEDYGEFGHSRTMYIQSLDASDVTADMEAYRKGRKPVMTQFRTEELGRASAIIGNDVTEFTNNDGSAAFNFSASLTESPEATPFTARTRAFTVEEAHEIAELLFPEDVQTDISVSPDNLSIRRKDNLPLQWELPTQEQMDAAMAQAQSILDSIDIGQWKVTGVMTVQYGDTNVPEYGLIAQASQLLNGLELTSQGNGAALHFTPDGTLIEIFCGSLLEVVEETTAKQMEPEALIKKAKSILASYPEIQTFGKTTEYSVEITDIVWGGTLSAMDEQSGTYEFVPSLILRGGIQFDGPEGQYLYSDMLGTQNRLILNAMDGNILYLGLPD